jgi:serine/threonine-protein kinase RsbW
VDAFKVDIKEVPKGTIVALQGDIGMLEVDALTAQFLKLLELKPALVVLDLSKVAMIASAGMGAMIAFRRDIGKVGGNMRLAAVTPQVREALRRALFDRLFQFYETVELALNGQ